MNPWELAARERKVARLVAEVDRLSHDAGLHLVHDAETVAAMMDGWDELTWAALADRAGVRHPSRATQQRVVGRLRSRLRRAS